MVSNLFQACGYKQKYEKFGNEIVATTIVQWVFKEKCAICISFIHHHKAGEFELPEVYIIMDDVIYSIDIQKLSGNNCYEAKFKIPDIYGLYQFKVDYTCISLIHLYSTT
ncbi:dolichyl-diphosphooligosaccharide--protein glycosyltransferase 48 kDa subunit-like [Ptiloglossa arizonensis]|uniref:dolichyl-diphosphooligosaccharide--protein glycosyltransferase 48 kDa subunit-like n=1 Tax=Ptiloglossa arizonensis TaxID=3350558 RepID=UPI003FA0F524